MNDVFYSHDHQTIYELRKLLEQIFAAHKTGRYEPLQAAIEAALAKMEDSK